MRENMIFDVYEVYSKYGGTCKKILIQDCKGELFSLFTCVDNNGICLIDREGFRRSNYYERESALFSSLSDDNLYLAYYYEKN